MASTFIARVIASDADTAVAHVARRLVAGFVTTGRVVQGPRNLMWDVEVANNGGDVNDCWVVLTSYGISPSTDLGSVWESLST